MGKVDDLRALREARYAANKKAANEKDPKAAAKKVAAAKLMLKQAKSTPPPTTEFCGHRSISNKSCTREKDHQAAGTKSHRYA